MTEAHFSAAMQHALDRYDVPALPAGFAERLIARVKGGGLTEPSDAVWRRNRSRRWSRLARPTAAAALLGLLTATAAAMGLFGPPVRIPVISALLEAVSLSPARPPREPPAPRSGVIPQENAAPALARPAGLEPEPTPAVAVPAPIVAAPIIEREPVATAPVQRATRDVQIEQRSALPFRIADRPTAVSGSGGETAQPLPDPAVVPDAPAAVVRTAPQTEPLPIRRAVPAEVRPVLRERARPAEPASRAPVERAPATRERAPTRTDRRTPGS